MTIVIGKTAFVRAIALLAAGIKSQIVESATPITYLEIFDL